MALFQWITTGDRLSLLTKMQATAAELGMEVDLQVSTSANIYARDTDNSDIYFSSRVTVIATPVNGSSTEYFIEVRSSEPMLKRGTRCESIAKYLKKAVPPIV